MVQSTIMTQQSIEEILEKAREIGLLIQDTDTYRQYRQANLALERDGASCALLERYYELSRRLDERRSLGDIISDYEEQEAAALREEVNGNDRVMTFLLAQKAYADFLMLIQQEIGESE
jgi:cell fate (sporulation/competence/biofilm development) regulator YlbF (YheA/YmcA/DUF963 family)